MKTPIIYLLYTCVSIFIVLGGLFGYVTFGYDLGDWLYIITTTSLWILVTILMLVNRKKKASDIYILLTVGMITAIVLLLLKITVLRGPEYKWNGSMFYLSNPKPAPKQNSVPAPEHVPALSQELYSQLMDYQHKYPLPVEKRSNGLYIYEAFFIKQQKDTILLIWRSSDGVVAGDNERLSGVYKGEGLSPTIIRDSKYDYGKRFINKLVYDSPSLKEMEPIRGERYPESHPPLHVYKVAGTHLILKRIDTVWTRW